MDTYIFKPDITLTKEGMWTVKVVLSNWKSITGLDLQRTFWTMIEGFATDISAGSIEAGGKPDFRFRRPVR